MNTAPVIAWEPVAFALLFIRCRVIQEDNCLKVNWDKFETESSLSISNSGLTYHYK